MRNGRSVEQWTRERLSALKQVEASWEKQQRRPTADEVEGWIKIGREGELDGEAPRHLG